MLAEFVKLKEKPPTPQECRRASVPSRYHLPMKRTWNPLMSAVVAVGDGDRLVGVAAGVEGFVGVAAVGAFVGGFVGGIVGSGLVGVSVG